LAKYVCFSCACAVTASVLVCRIAAGVCAGDGRDPLDGSAQLPNASQRALGTADGAVAKEPGGGHTR